MFDKVIRIQIRSHTASYNTVAGKTTTVKLMTKPDDSIRKGILYWQFVPGVRNTPGTNWIDEAYAGWNTTSLKYPNVACVGSLIRPRELEIKVCIGNTIITGVATAVLTSVTQRLVHLNIHLKHQIISLRNATFVFGWTGMAIPSSCR